MSVYTIVKDRTEKKEKSLAGMLCMSMNQWLARGGNYRGSIGAAAKSGFFTIRMCEKMQQPVTAAEFKNCMDFAMMKDCYTDNCLPAETPTGHRRRPCVPVFKRTKTAASPQRPKYIQIGIPGLAKDKEVSPKMILRTELNNYIQYKLGMSNSGFANLVGVSPATVTKWLYGLSEPSATNYKNVAIRLGMNLEQVHRLFSITRT